MDTPLTSDTTVTPEAASDLQSQPISEVEVEDEKDEGLDEALASTEESEFRIEQLFGSKTRARLLGLFLENSNRSFYVRELARRIDAQLNSVRRELKNLVDIGIVLEVEGQKSGDEEGETDNKRFYQANHDFPIFEDLRNVMKKVAVLMNHSLIKRLQSLGRLDLLVLTGRFTDSPTIQSDVLVVGDFKAEQVQQAIHEFEIEIAREVNYTYMPRTEFEYRRDVSDRFLASILQGKRIILHDLIGKL